MRRRLALWLYGRAISMEPLIAIAIQQAADENACERLRQALAEAQMADARALEDRAIVEAQQALALIQHQANAARIAPNN